MLAWGGGGECGGDRWVERDCHHHLFTALLGVYPGGREEDCNNAAPDVVLVWKVIDCYAPERVAIHKIDSYYSSCGGSPCARIHTRLPPAFPQGGDLRDTGVKMDMGTPSSSSPWPPLTPHFRARTRPWSSFRRTHPSIHPAGSDHRTSTKSMEFHDLNLVNPHVLIIIFKILFYLSRNFASNQ